MWLVSPLPWPGWQAGELPAPNGLGPNLEALAIPVVAPITASPTLPTKRRSRPFTGLYIIAPLPSRCILPTVGEYSPNWGSYPFPAIF